MLKRFPDIAAYHVCVCDTDTSRLSVELGSFQNIYISTVIPINRFFDRRTWMQSLQLKSVGTSTNPGPHLQKLALTPSLSQVFVLSQFLLSFFGATTKPLDCSFNMTMRSTAVSCLSYSMFCITSARFTALKLPLRYKRILHVRNQLAVCLLCISWACSLSIPPLFGVCGFDYNPQEERCEYLDVTAHGCALFYGSYCFFGILFPRLVTLLLYGFIYKSVRKNQSLKKRYARVTSFLNGLQNVLSITTVLTFVLTSENNNLRNSELRNSNSGSLRIRSPTLNRREKTMFNGAIEFVEQVKRPRGYSIVDRHPSGRTMRRYTSFECRKRTTYQKLVEDLHNVPFAIILVVVLTSLTVLPLLCNVIKVGQDEAGRHSWDWFLDIALLSLLTSLSCSPYAYLLTVKSIKDKFDITMICWKRFLYRKRDYWADIICRR